MSSPTELGIGADLAALRTRARELLGRQRLQIWEQYTRGSSQDTRALFAEHADLLADEALRVVERAREAGAEDPEQTRAADRLHAHLMELRLQGATREIDDELARLQGAATVACDGETIPYRRLPVDLAREADPARRRRLREAALPVLQELSPVLVERRRHAAEEARRLGFPGLLALSGRLRECKPAAFAPLAEEILSATAPLYSSLLEAVLEREAGVSQQEARPCDLYYIVRGGRHSRFFDPGALLDSVRSTLERMGIDLQSLNGLTIDSEERPGKVGRAFCLAVRGPDDVRLSLRPSGGPFDYDCLYHEIGHALHMLLSREQAFEFRFLGSTAVSEAYASLLEGLTAAPAWLRRCTAMPDRQRAEFRLLRAFRMLYLLRRYAAFFLLELRLDEEDPRDVPDLHRRLQERALGVSLQEADVRACLTELDDGLYNLEYLRGWLLEAALERTLRTRYGECWFEQPGAGSYLTRLWEKGGRYRAEELLEKLGQRRWSLNLFMERVQCLRGPS